MRFLLKIKVKESVRNNYSCFYTQTVAKSYKISCKLSESWSSLTYVQINRWPSHSGNMSKNVKYFQSILKCAVYFLKLTNRVCKFHTVKFITLAVNPPLVAKSYKISWNVSKSYSFLLVRSDQQRTVAFRRYEYKR